MDALRKQQLQKIRCFLLDMDGTIFLGGRLLPGAAEFIAYLKQSGRSFLFMTNNSSKNSQSYVEKLAGLGIECKEQDILTSGEATCIYLQTLKPGGKIYLLGTPCLEKEFVQAGFTLTEDHPDFVVLGFDKTLTYQKLVTACDLLRAGVPFIATHPDVNCPMEHGYIPDAGAMIALIRESTGVSPKIIGKPQAEMIQSAFQKRSFPLDEYAVVGDRLYTDIASGNKAGIASVLVLSGETQKSDLEKSPWEPSFIVPDVGEILNILKEE